MIPTDSNNMPHDTNLCDTMVSPYTPTLNGLYIGANVVVVNPLSTPLTLHTMNISGFWENDFSICPTARNDAQICNVTLDAPIPWPLKLFETPTAESVIYDFHVRCRRCLRPFFRHPLVCTHPQLTLPNPTSATPYPNLTLTLHSPALPCTFPSRPHPQVPPNTDGAVFPANMCFPQSLLSGFLCGLNSVFLNCLT